MKIILRLENFEFLDRNDEWWKDTNRLFVLLDIILNSHWREKIKYYSNIKDDTLTPFNLITIKSIAEKWEMGTYMFKSSNADNSNYTLLIGILPFGFEVLISEDNIDSKTTKEEVLDKMIDFAVLLYSSFAGNIIIGYRTGIEIYNVSYPAKFPKFKNYYWGASRIVDFIDMKYHVNSKVGKLDEATKLITLTLPNGVERFDINGLTIIKWVKDISDERISKLMLAARDEWIGANFNLQE